MPETLYIIDTFSLMFQVYHAIPPMTSPAGQATNAVFGFTRDIFTILKKKPDFLLCALDSEGPGVRSDWFPEYKAQRTEMPEDLRPQIPMITSVIEGFGIPVVHHTGWEADDIIATLTRQAEAEGIQVRIVSSDKDCRQLLSDHVQMFNCRKGEYFGAEQLREVWNITPEQVIDFQSLVGDSVDNVPGVPLVGPKKATILLEQFGDLEGVLANADKAPGKKLRENLVEFAEQARISKRLVTLRTDLPLDFPMESARVGNYDVDTLQQLFLDYGFRRFREDLYQMTGGGTDIDLPEESQIASKKQTRSLFSDSSNKETLGEDDSDKANAVAEYSRGKQFAFNNTRNWQIIRDEDELQVLIEACQQAKEICIDLETTSVTAMRADIVGWAVSIEPGTAWYIPIQAPFGLATLPHREVLELFKPLLESPDIEISNQNIKYDMLVLKRCGVEVKNIGMDPMVGHYLLDAGARSHGLDALADEFLKHRMIPISDLIGKGKNQKKMFEVDVERVGEYAAEDADVSLQLCHIMRSELQNQGLWDLYADVERPLIPILADMEFTGIRVDDRELFTQSRQAGVRIDELLGELETEAGRKFNPDSPKQLRELLFDEIGLPVQKRTKTGPSTDQSVLEKLALMHPLPAKIMEYRQLAKLKGTYLDTLPKLIHPETGRIHASFNQVVAATGRLSSSDPNLQNIPIRTPEGRQIRKAFIPGESGWELLCCDYSQIELRMLAHFSGDEALRDAFLTGKDIHTTVAAEVFEIDEENVDSDMRRVAKAVNFGVIYGQSPYGLAAALNIPQEQAAEFIDSYFGRYPGVEKFIEETLEKCHRTGYAYTILGRRRPITGIKNTTGRNRNMPERTAINTVIQGSAADLIKLAMLKVHDSLNASNLQGKMLLQIHDELVFESPVAEIDDLATLAKSNMETAMELNVPLVVDMKHGENWLDAE